MDIASALTGSVIGSGISFLAAYIKFGRIIVVSLAKISNDISRIDKERVACRESHDKYDDLVTEHHQNHDIHITSAWQDEIRDRFRRLEELQTVVLKKLTEKDS